MAKYDIQSETFTALAGKLKTFEGTLPDAEKGLLQTILSLADEQLKANEGQDVAGYSFGGTSAISGGPVQVSNVGALRTGFEGAFGGFTGANLGGLGSRAIVISVSF